jgi:hypothetical protein
MTESDTGHGHFCPCHQGYWEHDESDCGHPVDYPCKECAEQINTELEAE